MRTAHQIFEIYDGGATWWIAAASEEQAHTLWAETCQDGAEEDDEEPSITLVDEARSDAPVFDDDGEKKSASRMLAEHRATGSGDAILLACSEW